MYTFQNFLINSVPKSTTSDTTNQDTSLLHANSTVAKNRTPKKSSTNKPLTHSRLFALISTAMSISLASSAVMAGAKIEFGDDQWVSLGAGMRTEFNHVDIDAANQNDQTNFTLSSIRLYLGGKIHENIKFTFNTEKIDGQSVDVLDAIAQFEFGPGFNIWMGRLLTPADRIEMNGPYYALSWNQYNVPLFPSDQGGEAGRFGRDEGVVVWGSSHQFQYAVGFFDGLQGGANTDDNVLFATRLAYNFLNKEDNPAYYTSSTYYGGLGNIFTLALAFQNQTDGTGTTSQQGDFSGLSIDMLSETVYEDGGVLTVEGEYKDFDADFTPASGLTDCFCLFDGSSYFLTAAYLLPQQMGVGKLQPYFRYVENDPSDAAKTDSTELGINYVIKGHSARLNANFLSGDANISGYPGADTDTFTLGVQIQL